MESLISMPSTIQGCSMLFVLSPVGDEMGLLARFVAADVLAVEHDPGDELDDDPGSRAVGRV